MDDLLTKIGADTSNIIPASLEWVKFKDKLYGLPFLQDDWGFMWNTDAFTEAGLDPTKPPTTLEELADLHEEADQVRRRRVDRASRLHPRTTPARTSTRSATCSAASTTTRRRTS